MSFPRPLLLAATLPLLAFFLPAKAKNPRWSLRSWAMKLKLSGPSGLTMVLNGQPTIRGMRLSVRRVIEALALYPNWDDLRNEYPELEPEDIRQALEFAAQNLDDSILPIETA